MADETAKETKKKATEKDDQAARDATLGIPATESTPAPKEDEE